MVATIGAGPLPIPHKKLTTDKLKKAIEYCLSAEANDAAMKVSHEMKDECGARAVVASFHKRLSLESLRCDVEPGLPAVWFKQSEPKMKLSSYAADILVREMKIKTRDLQM